MKSAHRSIRLLLLLLFLLGGVGTGPALAGWGSSSNTDGGASSGGGGGWDQIGPDEPYLGDEEGRLAQGEVVELEAGDKQLREQRAMKLAFWRMVKISLLRWMVY